MLVYPLLLYVYFSFCLSLLSSLLLVWQSEKVGNPLLAFQIKILTSLQTLSVLGRPSCPLEQVSWWIGFCMWDGFSEALECLTLLQGGNPY